MMYDGTCQERLLGISGGLIGEFIPVKSSVARLCTVWSRLAMGSTLGDGGGVFSCELDGVDGLDESDG